MKRITLQERIYGADIDYDTGCLLIPKNQSLSIGINNRHISVSRIIYEDFYGELPKFSRIDRTCDNGRCINYKHMLPSSPEDKFWRKVDKTTDCWSWLGAKDGGGYGIFRSPHILEVKAHRISYELCKGKISNGLHVLHICDNPSCVNPKHLFLGTNCENVKDKMLKNRHTPMKGSLNGRSNISKEDVMNIRKLHESGMTYREIEKLYPIKNTQIGRIIRRESWAWLP